MAKEDNSFRPPLSEHIFLCSLRVFTSSNTLIFVVYEETIPIDADQNLTVHPQGILLTIKNLVPFEAKNVMGVEKRREGGEGEGEG